MAEVLVDRTHPLLDDLFACSRSYDLVSQSLLVNIVPGSKVLV
jgi:hypothetical protein